MAPTSKQQPHKSDLWESALVILFELPRSIFCDSEEGNVFVFQDVSGGIFLLDEQNISKIHKPQLKRT